MTIGIYALYWEEHYLVYIGESDNIERRFKEHIKMLETSKHFNHRVQSTYNTHGIPKLQVLEKCLISELKDKEVHWYNEFTSTLNIAPPGSITSTIGARNSKYSRLDILRIFRKLYIDTSSIKHLSIYLGVPESTLLGISRGSRHTWLSEEFPYQYNLMQVMRQKRNMLARKSQGIKIASTLINKFEATYPNIKSPKGEIFEVTNIGQFCREHPELNAPTLHSARTSIGKLLSGVFKQYKGWTVSKHLV